MLPRILKLVNVSLILLFAIGCTTPNPTHSPVATSPTFTPVMPSVTPSTSPTSISSVSSATSTTDILSQSLTIGEYQYVMECSGEGSPTVLLLGGRAATWKPIQAVVNQSVRTCVFDHMGSRPTPLTAAEVAKSVRTLLDDA